MPLGHKGLRRTGVRDKLIKWRAAVKGMPALCLAAIVVDVMIVVVVMVVQLNTTVVTRQARSILLAHGGLHIDAGRHTDGRRLCPS
jgi:hypothetical protein